MQRLLLLYAVAGLFTRPAILSSQSSTSSPIRAASSDVFETARTTFDYNRKARARLDTVATREEATFTRQKLVLNVAFMPPVPAFLAIPKSGKPPFPIVVFVHGYSSSKEEWFPPNSGIVDSVVGRGYAALALDSQCHGERASECAYDLRNSSGDVREWITRWTVEQRRMLDLLGGRSDLDTARVAVVGYSMGTLVTFAMAAVDERVKVAVAAVTPISIVKDRASVTFAPQTFAGGLRTPTLMLMAKKDDLYTADDADQLFRAIRDPRKELVWYDSGHMLPYQWVPKAVEWVAKYLK